MTENTTSQAGNRSPSYALSFSILRLFVTHLTPKCSPFYAYCSLFYALPLPNCFQNYAYEDFRAMQSGESVLHFTPSSNIGIPQPYLERGIWEFSRKGITDMQLLVSALWCAQETGHRIVGITPTQLLGMFGRDKAGSNLEKARVAFKGWEEKGYLLRRWQGSQHLPSWICFPHIFFHKRLFIPIAIYNLKPTAARLAEITWGKFGTDPEWPIGLEKLVAKIPLKTKQASVAAYKIRQAVDQINEVFPLAVREVPGRRARDRMLIFSRPGSQKVDPETQADTVMDPQKVDPATRNKPVVDPQKVDPEKTTDRIPEVDPEPSRVEVSPPVLPPQETAVTTAGTYTVEHGRRDVPATAIPRELAEGPTPRPVPAPAKKPEEMSAGEIKKLIRQKEIILAAKNRREEPAVPAMSKMMPKRTMTREELAQHFGCAAKEETVFPAVGQVPLYPETVAELIAVLPPTEGACEMLLHNCWNSHQDGPRYAAAALKWAFHLKKINDDNGKRFHFQNALQAAVGKKKALEHLDGERLVYKHQQARREQATRELEAKTKQRKQAEDSAELAKKIAVKFLGDCVVYEADMGFTELSTVAWTKTLNGRVLTERFEVELAKKQTRLCFLELAVARLNSLNGRVYNAAEIFRGQSEEFVRAFYGRWFRVPEASQ